jgi:hypothetical protein
MSFNLSACSNALYMLKTKTNLNIQTVLQSLGQAVQHKWTGLNLCSKWAAHYNVYHDRVCDLSPSVHLAAGASPLLLHADYCGCHQ